MGGTELNMHYVCTHDQAGALIQAHEQFWVCNCGCREARHSGCSRSRLEVCLMFNPDDPGSGSGKRPASAVEAQEILSEARSKALVARPYRSEDRLRTDGICFCCDDCCDYFLDPHEKCDPGERIAVTNADQCSLCGACLEVCYFDARKMENGDLQFKPDACYGCGLCVEVCPEECIEMSPR